MSQSNRDGKRAARERMAAERVRQQKRDRRRRQMSVLAGVLAVILVVVGIGLGVAFSGHSGSKNGDQAAGTKGASTPYAAPTGTVADKYFSIKGTPTPGISYGKANAPVTLSVIEDFRCPDCKEFETEFSSIYNAYVTSGQVRVIYHPVRLIDSNHPGTTGSMFAGSAALCAQDQGKFFQFHNELYANQPDETTDDYGKPATVLSVANKVPGLNTAAFQQCVKSGKYEGFVQTNWNAFQKFTSNIATPTLLLNGKSLQLTGSTTQQAIQNFENAIQNAGGGAPPASLKGATSSTPTPGSSSTPSGSVGGKSTATPTPSHS